MEINHVRLRRHPGPARLTCQWRVASTIGHCLFGNDNLELSVDEVKVVDAAVQERALRDDPLVRLETAVSVAGGQGASGAADDVIEHYVGAAQGGGPVVDADRSAARRVQAGCQAAVRAPPGGQRHHRGRHRGGGRFSTLACLQAAQAAADADGSVPGTHHLLLGLLHAGGAASVLDRLGVTRDKVSQASARLLEAMTVTGEDGEERRVTGDGEAGQAITGARRLAAQRGLPQVRTGHLLFCIALDPGSSARRILNDLGIDPAQVKKELAGTVTPVTPVQRRHRRYGRSRGGRPGLLVLRLYRPWSTRTRRVDLRRLRQDRPGHPQRRATRAAHRMNITVLHGTRLPQGAALLRHRLHRQGRPSTPSAAR